MVDITNGRDSLTVTKGAFEGIYKHLGYTLVNDYSQRIQNDAGKTVTPMDNKLPIEEEASTSDNLEQSEEVEQESPFAMAELLETPIGQWSKEQLKEFAEANNISIDGASTVREVRNIIKDFIDSAK
jgi:hypothetical protein